MAATPRHGDRSAVRSDLSGTSEALNRLNKARASLDEADECAFGKLGALLDKVAADVDVAIRNLTDDHACNAQDELMLALTLACAELEAAGHPMAAETYRAALAKAEGQ